MRSMEYTIYWCDFCMETFIFNWWWRSRQSLARKGLCIFRFCVMLWKDEREPTIEYCLGKQIGVVQEFITIQNFGHNWWWVNGILVGYSLRIHHIAAFATKFRISCQKWAYNQKISLDGLSSCRCWKTSHGDLKKISKNAYQALNSFRFMQKKSHQEDDHSLDLD